MSNGFIKLSRSKKTEELMRYPNAFTLFSTIAYRARRSNNSLNVLSLDIGEALVGDYATGRMTEQEYRTAKQQLTKFKLATFKGTNKGTIAKLTDGSIYDINPEEGNGQDNRQATDKVTDKQRTNNGQATTNKEYKNGKNGKNTKRARAHSSFEKPTLDEVKRHIADKDYHIEPEVFYNFYESNGWRVGRNSMKSWQAAVAQWEARERKDNKYGKEHTTHRRDFNYAESDSGETITV